MRQEEFDRFRKLIYTRTHIHCPDSHKSLFERKIFSRLSMLQLSSFQEYYTLLTESLDREQEVNRLIDIIAVHETSFFRISGHFHGLETQIFPHLLKHSHLPIHVWSAGCSTGEEPYSIAMTFLEVLARQKPEISHTQRIHIWATDVSRSVLKTAQSGIYTSQKVRKIPQPLLDKYFTSRHHLSEIRQYVQDLVTFQTFNLINIETVPPAQRFDIIFCRNLLIYFDRIAQHRLIVGLTDLLIEGGYLFLGDAESLYAFHEITGLFDIIEAGDAIIYQKRGVETP